MAESFESLKTFGSGKENDKKESHHTPDEFSSDDKFFDEAVSKDLAEEDSEKKEDMFIVPGEDNIIGKNKSKDNQPNNQPKSLSHRDMVYKKNVGRFIKQLVAEGNSVKAQNEQHIARQEKESALYRAVSKINTLGSEAEIKEANTKSSRLSWYNTRLNLNGPAYLRELWRRPMKKYKNLSEDEVKRIEKNRSDKVLWNKIIKGVEDVVPEGERKLTEDELMRQRKYNLDHGNFHLLRTVPTPLEAKLSKNRWGRGLYLLWKNSEPFPYAEAIDSDMRPSANLIKDEIEYERYRERDGFDNYLLKGKSSNEDAFKKYWQHRCLQIAEENLKSMKERKAQKKKMEEMEARKKRIEERKEKILAKRLAMEGDKDADIFPDKDGANDELLLKMEDDDPMDDNIDDMLFENKRKKKRSASDKALTVIQSCCCFRRRRRAKEYECHDASGETEDSPKKEKNPEDDDQSSEEEKEWKDTFTKQMEDFEAKKKQMFSKIKKKRRESRVVPFEAKEEEEAPPETEEIPANKKKKPNYTKKSNKNKRKLNTLKFESREFAKSQAPPDKKFLRQQSRKRRKEAKEAALIESEKEEAALLLELNKVTKVQQVGMCLRRVAAVLCCRCCRRNRRTADASNPPFATADSSASSKKWFISKKDAVLVETMFKVRYIERESSKKYAKLFGCFGGYTAKEVVQTPDELRKACLNGRQKDVIDILEDEDCSPNSVNSNGDTAFYATVQRALDGAGELDYDDDVNEIPVGFWGVLRSKMGKCFKKKRSKGQLDIILKILTVKGGDVNFVRVTKDKAEDGMALIHVAAKNNRLPMVDWLHEHDVNVNALTSLNLKTPLMLAAEEGHGEMVRSLLHKGCIDTIRNVDTRGWSVLHYAAAYCESEYVQMLLVCGAFGGLRSKANRLPIEEAKSRGKMENVEVLMFYADKSRMFTNQIMFFDHEATRQKVEKEQKREK